MFLCITKQKIYLANSKTYEKKLIELKEDYKEILSGVVLNKEYFLLQLKFEDNSKEFKVYDLNGKILSSKTSQTIAR